MIYIIEGPDGAGKTTLAEKLHKSNPGSLILHFGTPANEEEAKNYWKVYLNTLECHEGETLILDRSWYSDMVYGPVMRHRNEMTSEHKHILELAVLALGGGVVIYCTGAQRTLWSRCTARGESYIANSDQHKEICNKYNEVMHSVDRLPVIYYNTTMKW